MTFEDAFGLKIPDAAADPMQRVSDATAYIEAQLVDAYDARDAPGPSRPRQ